MLKKVGVAVLYIGSIDCLAAQTLQDAVIEARYAIHPSAPQNFTAWNPAQRIRAGFEPSGVQLSGVSNGESWRTAWTLRSFGYGAHQVSAGPASLTAGQTRVELLHPRGVSEWYVNSPSGVEQGFTLSHAPNLRHPGDRLRLVMELQGDLHARPSGSEIEMLTADGTVTLHYGSLSAVDATGRNLPAEMKLAAGNTICLEVDDHAAVWPITIDPMWAQQAYLKASNVGSNDLFGLSVAISGNTAVVGAPLEDSNGDQADNSVGDSGAVYIFTRTLTTWSQQAYLKASNIGAGDNFGWSVAISGDTVVVGAPNQDSTAANSGAAYVFLRTGSTWSQQASLKASNAGADDNFGWSVGISGDTIVVGAPGEDSSSAGVNGADNNNAGGSGAAYVFVRSAGAWTQQAYLKASNTGSGDQFGTAVAISTDTVVVGANFENNIALASGAAYVFFRSAVSWSQQGYLKASNAGANDEFGFAVAISGDTVVVGAHAEDGEGDLLTDAGAAYVFIRSSGAWSQQAYLKASNTEAGDTFGQSVAVSGDTVVVGAFSESSNATGVNGDQSNNSALGSGAAYVFQRTGINWDQTAYLKASNTAAFANFGGSIAISGDTAVVGASGESNGRSSSGAAYVFVFPSNVPPTITPSPVTRQQGTSGSAAIATVNDTEDTPGSLSVTVQSANPSNGVTVSGISNNAGNVTADVAATCLASSASFTLRVTDSAAASTDGTLNVTVTPSTPSVTASVSASDLWPNNSELVNVGLTATATGDCSPVLSFAVYSNEDDQAGSGMSDSPDAKDIGAGTLRLRAERDAGGDGRVYLIVATATDIGGHSAFAVATVVVPKNASQQDEDTVNALAAAARSYALANGGSAPGGYSLVGDGPVVGPKQ